ncbi:hypothetical protein [Shewanella algidipiscicola]|uniref:Uncharacterized protein n=1 Tax=Shewanella algidipiscicola TaxID=614070 RepID=A0ABQ4NTZ9_9GAMM|nr:hypothetical protein [Shewanella algidipiscicola]GIU03129.1 hypothetical protein TUM4630_36290 [Shewanella algidipiscicola]
MTDNFDLQDAISALDEYGYEKKQTSGLENARNANQMETYLKSLNYNLRRLTTLQTVVNKLVDEEEYKQAQTENIQTYKSKIINLSRQYDLSFDDVIEIMRQQKS